MDCEIAWERKGKNTLEKKVFDNYFQWDRTISIARPSLFEALKFSLRCLSIKRPVMLALRDLPWWDTHEDKGDVSSGLIIRESEFYLNIINHCSPFHYGPSLLKQVCLQEAVYRQEESGNRDTEHLIQALQRAAYNPHVRPMSIQQLKSFSYNKEWWE